MTTYSFFYLVNKRDLYNFYSFLTCLVMGSLGLRLTLYSHSSMLTFPSRFMDSTYIDRDLLPILFRSKSYILNSTKMDALSFDFQAKVAWLLIMYYLFVPCHFTQCTFIIPLFIILFIFIYFSYFIHAKFIGHPRSIKKNIMERKYYS